MSIVGTDHTRNSTTCCTSIVYRFIRNKEFLDRVLTKDAPTALRTAGDMSEPPAGRVVALAVAVACGF